MWWNAPKVLCVHVQSSGQTLDVYEKWHGIFYFNTEFSTFMCTSYVVYRIMIPFKARQRDNAYEQHKHESNFMAETLYHISCMAHNVCYTFSNAQLNLTAKQNYKIQSVTKFSLSLASNKLNWIMPEHSTPHRVGQMKTDFVYNSSANDGSIFQLSLQRHCTNNLLN